MDPMDRSEPLEPIDSNESSDHSDHCDRGPDERATRPSCPVVARLATSMLCPRRSSPKASINVASEEMQQPGSWTA
jgi:hypothetical protein